MPLDIGLLTKPLTPAETPGLDTLDPRFQEIAGFVEAGEFVKAAEATQALLNEGIVDIRVIAYFLYGNFVEGGFDRLPAIFDAVRLLFTQSWPAVGPVSKKERHTESGLVWFFTRLLKKCQGNEEDKNDEWNTWLANVQPETVGAALEKAEGLKAAMAGLQPPLATPKAPDALKIFGDWLGSFQKLVTTAKVVEAPPPPPPEEPKKDEPKAETKAAPAGATISVAPGSYVAEGSYHLEELRLKLEAFEKLVKKKDFARAAVIAYDVGQVVEKFDPRVFLPKMFSSFYRLSVDNHEAIGPLMEQRETPVWRAMEQLYRVDRDAFSK